MLGALDREHQRVGGGEAQSAAQPRKILLPSGHKNVIIAGFGGGVIEDRQARNEGGRASFPAARRRTEDDKEER